MNKHLTLLLLTGMVLFMAMGSASAADTYVNATLTTGTHTGESWENAFNTIQEGITGVTNNGTVFLAAGNYNGTGNKDIDVSKSFTLQGAGKENTIIDAENTNNILDIYDGTITIKDLTIRNGYESGWGGAIGNLGTLTIINCNFENNRATIGGGAIYTGENPWYPEQIGTCNITGCTFTGNSASGDGGAIYNNRGTLTVTGSTFTGNTVDNNLDSCAGAIYNGYGTLTVKDCVFTDNTATGAGGGAILNWGTCTITGSIFTGNTAMYAGAIYNRAFTSEGSLTVTGCNIASNSASWDGGVFYNWGTLIAHFNRIIGNTATNFGNAIYNAGSGSADAENNWWGNNTGPNTSNLFVGPVYADPWLVLNIYADPSTIYTGQTSTITANVYMDSNGNNHSGDAAQFFSGPNITLTTDLGTIGSNSITVPWVLGQAVRPLLANEGPGVANVTAADVEIVQTTVNMLQAPVTPSNEVNAASNTVEMQETGIPVAGLILAVLAVFSGLFAPKRK
ncbi:MAG: hypothetical protein QMD61_00775 [Methanobacterium sp.]|nr:hypothetical protein [Methanobacterium sp.]